MLYMATGKPDHLGCKFLSDVSVVNSPIVVELLVITVLFCVVLPAYVLLMMGEIVTRNMQSKAIAEIKNAIVESCWTYFTTIGKNVEHIVSGDINSP